MLLPLILTSLTHLAPAPRETSLLASVPADAYVLVHCRDFAALRARAERNDWYRLLGSSHGEPALGELARELRRGTHSELDQLLALGQALDGEVVFFDSGAVAGFVTRPSARPTDLAELMRAWLPAGDSASARRFEVAGGNVQLVAWPDELDGWSGHAGHFAAFVDHPQALALYSGDDSAAVLAALTEGLSGLGSEQRSPLVTSYLESGGGRSGGVEVFVDFTPLVGPAEAALKQAVKDVLPDPTSLLGLESGTWLHASADLFEGTRIDCHARLHLPADTLAAKLADTFRPLPRTLPADLPKDVWGLWALNWDLKLFYRQVRSAYEQAGQGEGLQRIDAGLQGAQGLVGVDPVADVLNQLAGDFALYFVAPPRPQDAEPLRGVKAFLALGFQAGLIDGDAFLLTFEQLIEVGGLESVLDTVQLAGVQAYVRGEDTLDGDGLDGGLAFLPRRFVVSPSRSLLERSLQALTRVEGASVVHGTPMQAVIDENAGACYLTCVELTPLRGFLQAESKETWTLPALESGQPARDPFDSRLIGSARRTADGFEFALQTR